MKQIILSFAFLFLSLLGGYSQSKEDELEGIQKKIEEAFVRSEKENSLKPLQQINRKLSQMYTRYQQNRTVVYWQAYTSYYTAIYYFMQKKNELSEKSIEKSVGELEKLKNKNSEEYALLALTQSFSIQFKSLFKKISLAKALNENAKKAIAKDKNNLRGYYVLGSSDFYRPEKFGGGKLVEKYLKKAISLPTTSSNSKNSPSWGKAESYELLIKWYIRKKKMSLAKKYYNEASKKYPNNYGISLLKKEF